MKALTFLIELTEPLLATQPHSGEANSRTSFDYIPGSMIRGALIRAYQRKGNPVDPGDVACRPLFFDGTVRFLNAYPAHPSSSEAQLIRMLPRPKSWFREKDAGNDTPVVDYAGGPGSLDKPKPAAGTYCRISGGEVDFTTPERHVTVHNASDDRNAKRQGDSQMFRYDAIAAGERFVGVIISETEAALQTLQELLELQFFLLGGSHSSGYGRVDISQISLIPDWHEFEPAASAKSGIRLTLLSDAILRDPGSAQTTSSLKQALDLARDPDREFVGTVLIGGFNRKWGLHLPQEWALQAGSVFCFPAGAIPDKRLETMVHEGVGERRLDGFGRVAVNWHGTDQYRETELPQIIPKSSPTLSGIGKKLAGTMAQRLLRQRLEQQLTDVVINYEGAFRSLPSRSQLSRVRVAARHALQSLDLTRITLHLSSLKGAKFDWLNSRVRNRISNSYEPLYEWVQRHANPASGDFLTVFSLTAGLPDLAGISGEITPELEAEYRARLIDGVMKLALEELKRKEGSDEG